MSSSLKSVPAQLRAFTMNWQQSSIPYQLLYNSLAGPLFMDGLEQDLQLSVFIALIQIRQERGRREVICGTNLHT